LEVALGALVFVVLALLGLPLAMVGLLVVIPIRVGAAGSYREEAYDVRGWARAFAGLLWVVFDYDKSGGQFRVMLGRWILWRPRAEKSEAAPELVEEEPAAPRPVRDVRAERDAEEVAQAVAAREAPEPVVAYVEEAPHAEPQASRAEEPKASTLDQGAPEEKKESSLHHRWRSLKAQVLRYRKYWHWARPIVGRLLRRLWRVVRFRSADLDAVLGASDPSVTGRVFGYAEAVRPLMGPRVRLAIAPDFVRTRFEVSGQVEVKIFLWRLLWAAVCLAVRGGVVGFFIWRAERRAKRLEA